MNLDVEQSLRQLRELGFSLPDCYPWTFKLGAELHLRRPDWWEQLQDETLASRVMQQAADFEFVRMLEGLGDVDPEFKREVDREIAAVLEDAPPYMRQELTNTAQWYAEQAANAGSPESAARPQSG